MVKLTAKLTAFNHVCLTVFGVSQMSNRIVWKKNYIAFVKGCKTGARAATEFSKRQLKSYIFSKKIQGLGKSQ